MGVEKKKKKSTFLYIKQVLGGPLPGKPLIAYSLSSLSTGIFKCCLVKICIVFNEASVRINPCAGCLRGQNQQPEALQGGDSLEEERHARKTRMTPAGIGCLTRDAGRAEDASSLEGPRFVETVAWASPRWLNFPVIGSQRGFGFERVLFTKHLVLKKGFQRRDPIVSLHLL